jgi:hypothetical protein
MLRGSNVALLRAFTRQPPGCGVAAPGDVLGVRRDGRRPGLGFSRTVAWFLLFG